MTWHLTPLGERVVGKPAMDPFFSLQRELDRVLEDVWGLRSASQTSISPLRLDVKEDDKTYYVLADMPGMEEKDVEVTFHGGVLTLRGEKKIERDEKKETWHVTERTSGSFTRQLALPEKIEVEKIAAKFEKGVLTVVLPKKEEVDAKARKIEIKSQ